jgi:hypothetical protein
MEHFRARQLADRLQAFNDEAIHIVQALSSEQWTRICREEWPVGVTARHIAVGHYDIIEFVRMIVRENILPDFSEEEVRQAANEHARKHADCTQQEVLDLLRENAAALIDFVSGLRDDELEQRAYLSLAGQKVSAENFIREVVLNSGGEHLESIKAALKS